jgi:hypothetical protein
MIGELPVKIVEEEAVLRTKLLKKKARHWASFNQPS